MRDMANQPLNIPPAWNTIELGEARGTLMVIGATDTGKSTFARYLYRRLGAEPGRQVAYLDGDPGQSTLGPPTTRHFALGTSGEVSFPPEGQTAALCSRDAPRAHAANGGQCRAAGPGRT
jgi:hypothetical protein